MLSVQSGRPLLITAVILFSVVTFLVVSALHATLQGVYSAALYRYATDHAAPLPDSVPSCCRTRSRRRADHLPRLATHSASDWSE